jgi:O-antigen/teichoic acid export membrane protein
LYLPMASRLDSNNQNEELKNIYQIITKWIFILTFPVFSMIIFYPETVMTTLFKPAYAGASTTLSILTLGFFTNAAMGRNRETLAALGNTKQVMTINVSGLIANVVLNIVLIPRLSYNGAAVASAVSFILINSAAFILLKREYDITPLSEWSVRTFIALPLILLPLGYLVTNFTPDSVTAMFIYLIANSLLTVGAVLVFDCIQPEDVVIIESIEEKIGMEIPYVKDFVF